MAAIVVTSVACHTKKKAVAPAISSTTESEKLPASTTNAVRPSAPKDVAVDPPPATDSRSQTSIDADCATITYATIRPLVNKKCNSCHNEKMNDLNFKDYKNFLAYSKNDEIRKHVLVNRDMPPQEKLSDSELAQFQCWVKAAMRQ